MKSYCIAIFLATITSVIAQTSTSPFYITNPLPGTVLKAGDSVDLEWNNGLDQTVNVIMIQGHDSGTMKPTEISFDVEGDDGSYTFHVPKTLADAGTYAFQFEYKDQNGSTQYAYSGPVSVSGGSGTIAPSVAAATATAPAVAPASSAAVHAISSPSASPSSAIIANASSPSASASSVSASSKNTSSASSTPTPNSSSGIKAIGFVLVIPALMMVALAA